MNKAYVYIQSGLSLWTVGFYDMKGYWHSDSEHNTRESAQKQVHYLNGSKSTEELAGELFDKKLGDLLD